MVAGDLSAVRIKFLFQNRYIRFLAHLMVSYPPATGIALLPPIRRIDFFIIILALLLVVLSWFEPKLKAISVPLIVCWNEACRPILYRDVLGRYRVCPNLFAWEATMF